MKLLDKIFLLSLTSVLVGGGGAFLVSPKSDAQQPYQITVSSAYYAHASWCIWHEGVYLYYSDSKLISPDLFRTQCAEKQSDSPVALDMIAGASDQYTQSFLEQAAVNLPIERQFQSHLNWVAYHEGRFNELRSYARIGNAQAIRNIYFSEQYHSSDARNLHAAVSDADLIEMCLNL
jgi:hypothetical protein